MNTEVKAGLLRNWGLKLAALFLSLLLYVAVAAQELVVQDLPMRLEVRVPPGRTLLYAPDRLTAVLRGRIAELLRLRLLRQSIMLQVPDTLSAGTWTTTVPTSSVELPKNADVSVAEIRPSEVTIQLDSVASKEVPVVPRLRIQVDSGQALDGGLQITPSEVRIVGPDRLLAGIDSVYTEPTALAAVRGNFTRLVPLDTEALGVVRLTQHDVRVSGSTVAVFERVFNLLSVESGAGPLTGYDLHPARATVTVRGAETLVQGLTADSLKVIVHLTGPVADSARVRLRVIAPRSLTTQVSPDSVWVVRRRSRHG